LSVLSCACVAAWGSTVVLFIRAASVLDRLPLLNMGAWELPDGPEGKLGAVPVRFRIDGLEANLGFVGDGFPEGLKEGFAGVFVGESDTGKAKAADTFCGQGFLASTGITGFFTGETALGMWLTVAADEGAGSAMVSSISVAKAAEGRSESLDEEAAEGKRSRAPVEYLRSPGGLTGARARCGSGRVVDFLIGDIFGVGAFTPESHGALGVFDISKRAAFIGVCDT
jgi:hypothetical protein